MVGVMYMVLYHISYFDWGMGVLFVKDRYHIHIITLTSNSVTSKLLLQAMAVQYFFRSGTAKMIQCFCTCI